jgi:hypothetical protein
MKRKVDTRASTFNIVSLHKGCFDLSRVIFFENNLYEKINGSLPCTPRHKYRVILNSDDYDYVTDRNLKRRLDRAFAREGV